MRYSVVILSKTLGNLNVCLAQIAALNSRCRVIVVDDGLDLSDGVARGLGWNLCGKIGLHLVAGAKPFIFARNANIGIAAAGEDHVILLNDDALLRTPLGFDRLAPADGAFYIYADVSKFTSDAEDFCRRMLTEAGVATTPGADFDPIARIANRDMDLGVLSPATSGVGNESQSLWAEGDSTKQGLRYEPKVLCFVCVYIRREVLKALGPLDERFTSYGWEDNDYCRRALKAGYKLGIYDPVQVDHTSLKSTFRGFGHCDMTFNKRIYEEKWGRG